MLRNRHRQKGESNFGCLFALVLLLIGILIGYKMIPIKIKAAELKDIVTDESRAAGQHTDKQIREVILDQAQKLELPVTEESVKINRRANDITVEVEYVVPVNFPGYVYNWNFHHKAENPIF